MIIIKKHLPSLPSEPKAKSEIDQNSYPTQCSVSCFTANFFVLFFPIKIWCSYQPWYLNRNDPVLEPEQPVNQVANEVIQKDADWDNDCEEDLVVRRVSSRIDICQYCHQSSVCILDNTQKQHEFHPSKSRVNAYVDEPEGWVKSHQQWQFWYCVVELYLIYFIWSHSLLNLLLLQ